MLATYCRDVPGIATSAGGPAVTMISAGLVLTKMVGASAGLTGFPGTCFSTSAKFLSLGRAWKAGGRLAAGLKGPA